MSHSTTYRQLFTFYFPLALQSISQSLTYPLVGSIVAHGFYGVQEYTAFAQSHMLMFFFGSINSALVTTGMVFGKTKAGMRNFCALNLRLLIFVLSCQILMCTHPFDQILFGKYFGFAPEIIKVARTTLLLSLPMQIGFFIRTRSLVLLYNEKRSGAANAATASRILATVCLTPIFVQSGLVGHLWGVVAMTLPIYGEVYLTNYFARDIRNKLTDTPDDEPSPISKQFKFTIPLSFGTFMLSFSAFMIAVFLAKTQDPTTVLAVHHVSFGIINPINFAALRTQTVSIAFPATVCKKSKLIKFSLMVGLIWSACSFVLQIPAVGNYYFGVCQNLSPEHIKFAQMLVLVMSIRPFVQALRGRVEGLAAYQRHPNAILAGQAVYLTTVICMLLFLLKAQLIPEYLIGGAAIVTALVSAYITVHIALLLYSRGESHHNHAQLSLKIASTTE